MTQTLNIPIKLLRRYRRDKAGWDLLALAVCVKMMSQSSTIEAHVKTLRRSLRCSYDKAVRLLNDAKRCKELFVYDEHSHTLTARSFTHGKLNRYVHFFGRGLRTFYGCTCLKLTFDKVSFGKDNIHTPQVSHFAVARRLRDELIKYGINAVAARDDLHSADNDNDNYSSRARRGAALTCHKLSRICGYHKSTVSRHVRTMERNNVIGVKRHDCVRVYDIRASRYVTDDRRLLCRRAFAKGAYMVVRDANDYSKGDAFGSVFTHVIFNHIRRHHDNVSSNDPAFSCGMMRFSL